MKTVTIYGGEILAMLMFSYGFWLSVHGEKIDGAVFMLTSFVLHLSCQNDRLKKRIQALEDGFIPSYPKEDNQPRKPHD